MKAKKCKSCKELFNPLKPLQSVCSAACAQVFALDKKNALKRKEEAAERKLLRAKLEKLKTRQQHLKEAQVEFNKFIRTRDRDLPCISCQRHHAGSYDAGHYRSVGAAPHLRFNEDGCHKQCVPCNQHKSGNIVEFRRNLIAKIGLQRLEALENANEPKRYTIEEAKAIKALYKQKTKELTQ